MAIQDEIPKSRITLTYRTTINGQPETVNLPFRLLVLGDFSHGTSKDQSVDLEERKVRSLSGNNLDAIIRDQNIKLKLQVANKINPDESAMLDVELPITGVKSFGPDEVAKNVPQVKALLLLRALLLEAQSNIDNRKDLRKKIYELFANPDQLKAAVAELKGYDSFTVPAAPSANALPNGATKALQA
jgi:type VI secretion system protein ImpB